MPNLTYQCTWCGDESVANGIQTLCHCGKPLEVVFDWGKNPPKKSGLNLENKTLWKYRDVLPPIDNDQIMTLGEGWTPMGDSVDFKGSSVFFKDETVNPTGSFKDRGMALAISHARKNGISEVCLPSAGNAGVSAAAYCQAAEIKCHVFLPEMIPNTIVEATEEYGADLRLGGRIIAQAAGKMREEMEEEWFDLSTLKEPFRVEGKKTMGYEIAEQLDWTLPDVVVYPTGGGTGLVGMWKAFNEMIDLGWVTPQETGGPRMVAVQSDGCAPVVKAFVEGKQDSEPWKDSHTEALGLNVPSPLGGGWMLKTIRDSGGNALMVDETQVMEATSEVNDLSGVKGSPEEGVSWLGFKKLVETGWIKEGEKVVMPLTGAAERYA
jgi:threonine synthase|tara:strand:- start:580 stop:1716 length:1137 start_codon:yes stop_codon:yes gene_type:complete